MLNLIVDQYLSFAELQAKQRRVMHMKDWVKKLDDFLTLNDREILDSAGKISKLLATDIAEGEFDKFEARQRTLNPEADISDFDRYVRRIEAERSKG